jgi:predicted ArsR family transcriptional regulator
MLHNSAIENLTITADPCPCDRCPHAEHCRATGYECVIYEHYVEYGAEREPPQSGSVSSAILQCLSAGGSATARELAESIGSTVKAVGSALTYLKNHKRVEIASGGPGRGCRYRLATTVSSIKADELPPPSDTSMATRVLERVRTEALTTTEIAAKLGVSSSAVRRAIRGLSDDGVIRTDYLPVRARVPVHSASSDALRKRVGERKRPPQKIDRASDRVYRAVERSVMSIQEVAEVVGCQYAVAKSHLRKLYDAGKVHRIRLMAVRGYPVVYCADEAVLRKKYPTKC